MTTHRLQLPNERAPLTCTRTRAGLILAIVFALGFAAATWARLLLCR